MSFFKKAKSYPTVTFATTCWERDWQTILENPNYLQESMIGNHCFAFQEKILLINNVKNPALVHRLAKKKVKENILTKAFQVEDLAEKVLEFFQLKKSDFTITDDALFYEDVDDLWIYYNAIGVLTAIYVCQSDYLLYMTGDVFLPKPVKWIEKAVRKLQKSQKYKVANLIWNNRTDEVKKESYTSDRNFFLANQGFSDQMFLVKTKDFQKPIYKEIRSDSSHFPRGDVFEKRVFSYLKNRGYERIIYKKGYYLHEDTPCHHLRKKA